ncbi:Colicin V production protein [Clostridiales bacterium CHKCI001]|nr:Colicin V production protein [Clostridiales bacterium CHKCI001]
MINWLTIAVIIILLLELLIGWKKGLVRMVFSFAISIVTFVIILVAGPYVEQYVKENTSIYETMQANISVFVQENLQQNVSEMTQTQEESITQLPLPEFIQDMLRKDNTVEQYATNQVNGLSDSISSALTDIAFRVLIYVAMFIIISIVLRIGLLILDSITKLPGIHLANAIGGAIFGLINALIFIWILCMIVTALASTEFGINALGMIKESPFLSFIYNNNLLLQLIAVLL